MDRSEVEKISKALADETRLRIFEDISSTNRTKLITCQREGQFVYNEAVPETIADYTRALGKIAGGGKVRRRR